MHKEQRRALVGCVVIALLLCSCPAFAVLRGYRLPGQPLGYTILPLVPLQRMPKAGSMSADTEYAVTVVPITNLGIHNSQDYSPSPIVYVKDIDLAKGKGPIVVSKGDFLCVFMWPEDYQRLRTGRAVVGRLAPIVSGDLWQLEFIPPWSKLQPTPSPAE